MEDVPQGYIDCKVVRRSERSEVYEAVREADGLPVILKSYRADTADDPKGYAAREFSVLRRLAVPRIPSAIALDRTTARPLLIMNRLPGLSITRLLGEGPLLLDLWLEVALQLADTLAQIHDARVLHKDLSPNNILLDRKSGSVAICDFGLAAQLGDAERRDAALEGRLEGTLVYIAPEQTGRMNRGCDFRSDLYTLGATLYHACTGRPPFESADPLELIHAHIARNPLPPSSVRAGLPDVVSRLVLKLLRKEPEERYPSARALYADLHLFRQHLSLGTVPELELGTTHTPSSPRFSQRVYGRERELERLLALQAATATGGIRSLWIRGEPGIGKSALVDQLRPHLALTGAYLAVGRFDPQRDRPYDGWIVALELFVQQLLVESDARLQTWAHQLRQGLGNIAGAITEIIPDLAFVVRDVPAVPKLGARETQARLSLALQRFFRVCATPDHPLVIFLDDMQWADAASRSLVEDVLSMEGAPSLFMVAALRSNEVDEGHALTGMLERIARRGFGFETFDLQPVGSAAVTAFLADALERPADAVAPLGELIERKTGNSPLLVRQFVDHIHERGLLRYRSGDGWSWDHEEVVAADIPDGAAGFMAAKLDQLEIGARDLIQFASCVGDEFDVDSLCELSQQIPVMLEQHLYALCDVGLIAPCSRGFRFVHSRIREAARARLSEPVRARLHYDMARLLIARTPEADRSQRVFLIVEHLNRGRAFLSEELRLEAIRLNVLAGRKALGTGAAATAEGYLSVARDLFGEQEWTSEHVLGFELLLSSAECALLRRDFEAALATLDELDQRSPSVLEATNVAMKRIQVKALTVHPEECTRYALDVLAKLGVHWPIRPSRWRAAVALLNVQWKVWRRGHAELLHPASAVDPIQLAPILVMGIAGGAMARVSFNLGVLASCWVLCSNLRRGYLTRPGYTISVYAGSLQMVLQAARAARRMVQLALDWNERVPDPVYGPRTEMQIQALVRPWWMRRRQAIAPLDQITESMREVGDLEYASYAQFLKVIYGALAGQTVAATEEAFLQLVAGVQRRGHRYPEPERCYRAYHLLGDGDSSLELELRESDAWIETNQGSAESYIRTLWMMVLCIYDRHDLAFEQSEKIGKRLFEVVPYVHVADHTFYRGLSAAMLARSSRGRLRRRHVKELRQCVRRLRRWAKSGPDFGHMATLLEAERSWLQGRAETARSLYQQAARLAQKQEYVHHAALACDLHAKALSQQRRETEASAMLREACAFYEAWGARRKVVELTAEDERMTGR
jgi:histidine kinase